jgi:hypothetical protein
MNTGSPEATIRHHVLKILTKLMRQNEVFIAVGRVIVHAMLTNNKHILQRFVYWQSV